MQTLEKISDHISSLDGSDTISEYSLDFCTETDSQTTEKTADRGMNAEERKEVNGTIPEERAEEDAITEELTYSKTGSNSEYTEETLNGSVLTESNIEEYRAKTDEL